MTIIITIIIIITKLLHFSRVPCHFLTIIFLFSSHFFEGTGTKPNFVVNFFLPSTMTMKLNEGYQIKKKKKIFVNKNVDGSVVSQIVLDKIQC